MFLSYSVFVNGLLKDVQTDYEEILVKRWVMPVGWSDLMLIVVFIDLQLLSIIRYY